MRIVNVCVPSINVSENINVQNINVSENINVCDTVYSTAHFYNQFHCT